MNRRMVKELQKELTEKNRLLNYRGKVIKNLRKTVACLNATNTRLHGTLFNLTRALTSNNLSKSSFDHEKEEGSRKSDAMISFADVRAGASKGSRPCCMALNRMTDILREYMETTQELRQQVAGLRRDQTDKPRITTEAKIAEKYFKTHVNFTKRQEKYSTYQLYSDSFFYETIPLNRMEPKQKLNSKIFRRNHDFNIATRSAIADIARKYRLKPALFEVKDSIFRYDELNGAKYMFNFLYNKTKRITSDVFKPYAEYMTSHITLNDVKSAGKELINIIVSVSGRGERLIAFLKNIHEIRETREENIFVTIVIYDIERERVREQVKRFSREYNFTAYDILQRNVSFNRGHALHAGIIRWNGYSNVLMFLCDIDIKVKPEFLDRCRQYSVAGKSVYMPIVFSLYNPEIVFGTGNKTLHNTENAFNLSDRTGTWRPFGYGMTCFHRPDYLKVGGFNLKIRGWGREDYNLYTR